MAMMTSSASQRPLLVSRTARKWHCFWSTQSDPLYSSTSEEHRQGHARELALLFLDKPPQCVLEIGCGDGALFVLLGFDCVQYIGVDFSSSMLAAFRVRHPNVNLIHTSADIYQDGCKYDLIFSNQVLQYLDCRMLRRMMSNITDMLAPDGCLILGSIPWRVARFSYYTDELHGQILSSLRRTRAIIAGLLGSKIGRWYSPVELISLGQRHGLKSEVFGSLQYPYRFHVRMT
jgi:cyclopropane fatty-acyl-phospholipid synthase-like methyltransferase